MTSVTAVMGHLKHPEYSSILRMLMGSLNRYARSSSTVIGCGGWIDEMPHAGQKRLTFFQYGCWDTKHSYLVNR